MSYDKRQYARRRRAMILDTEIKLGRGVTDYGKNEVRGTFKLAWKKPVAKERARPQHFQVFLRIKSRRV